MLDRLETPEPASAAEDVFTAVTDAFGLLTTGPNRFNFFRAWEENATWKFVSGAISGRFFRDIVGWRVILRPESFTPKENFYLVGVQYALNRTLEEIRARHSP
jgi:hypothetical protein